MSLPTFSVLLLNYNQEPYIERVLQAILSQSLRPDEIIIIDDGSNDNSIETIHRILKKEPWVRFIQNEKNRGVNYTATRIINEATCEYFHTIGVDDLMLPGFYEKSINLLSQYPQAALCSAIVQCEDIEGKILNLNPAPPYPSGTGVFLSPDEILSVYKKYGTWYCGTSAIWRRETLLASGGFGPAELGSLVDTIKFFELGFKYGVCFCPEILHTWTVSAFSYSATARLDPSLALGLHNRAEAIITNHPEDIFPSGFLEEFRGQEFATFGNTVFNKMDSDQSNSLSLLEQAFTEINFADRFVIVLSKSLMRLHKLSLQIYLGFRLRRFNGVFLIRMLYHFKDCLKKLIK